jgi:solute carrier family 35, member F5
VTYLNGAFFVIPLVPILVARTHRDERELVLLKELLLSWVSRARYTRVAAAAGGMDEEEDGQLLKPDGREDEERRSGSPSEQLLLEDELGNSQSLRPANERDVVERLTVADTAKLGFEFSLLWVSGLRGFATGRDD